MFSVCLKEQEWVSNYQWNVDNYLITSQFDSDRDVNGVVNHTHHWSDQWNEKKGKPDDAD